MKMKVVSSAEELNAVGPNEEIVFFAFRPSNTDILALVMNNPHVKALHIPSCGQAISNYVKKCLEIRGIKLLKSDMWNSARISEVAQCLSRECVTLN